MAGDLARAQRTTTLALKVARKGAEVGKKYAKQYVDQAKTEIQTDIVRIAASLMMLFLAGLLSLHGVFFMHALVVSVLVELGLRWFEVFGVAVAFDFGSVLLLLLVARAGLLRPLLPRTRKRVNDLLAFLAEEE